MGEISCPFCGVTSSEAIVIEVHIEENHSNDTIRLDGQASSAMRKSVSASVNGKEKSPSLTSDWTKCTRSGCGEYVLMTEMDEHLDLHAAMMASEYESTSSNDVAPEPNFQRPTYASMVSQPPKAGKAKHRPASTGEPPRRAPTLKDYFSGDSVRGGRHNHFDCQEEHGRLGRRELGPHAYEKRMPDHVRHRLLNDAKPRRANRLDSSGRVVTQTIIANETAGILPILADLCALDETTGATYLCSPSVRHVHKLRCDGNFCGFWNIQVMLSYLQATGSVPGMDHLPNVLELQDTIEQAWDDGICPYGRTETGGIRGTRKWIGTSEAAAYFMHIGVQVEAMAFKNEANNLAVTSLLDYVEAYYLSGHPTAKVHGTTYTTDLGPIYLQRRGHSMSIVGIERHKDGSRNLLVFDSSFATSDGIRRVLAGRTAYAKPETLLRPYRRSDASLTRWDEFEILVAQPSRV